VSEVDRQRECSSTSGTREEVAGPEANWRWFGPRCDLHGDTTSELPFAARSATKVQSQRSPIDLFGGSVKSYLRVRGEGNLLRQSGL